MAAKMDSTKWEGRTNFGRMRLRSRDESAILTASKECLLLESALGDWTLRPGAVLRVERAGITPWCWRGILIEHRAGAPPPCIAFLADGVPTVELLRRLEE
jgi:hypothetical protein